MRTRKIGLVAAALVVVFVAVTGAALATTHTSSAAGTINMRKTALGTVLDDAQGRTLSLFTTDKHGKSSCSGACATDWPPLIASGKVHAGSGTKAALLATVKRADGRKQVTYNGHPLYRFFEDTKAGQTKGENLDFFGGHWYAVSASGAKVLPNSGGGGGGGYGGGGYGGGGGGY